jgi:hypothetical protein
MCALTAHQMAAIKDFVRIREAMNAEFRGCNSLTTKRYECAPAARCRAPRRRDQAVPLALLPSAAWAAARRAIGTRNGEHDT